jgi:hypothetical protein
VWVISLGGIALKMSANINVVLQLQHAPPMQVCCVCELASQHDELCEHQEMAMQEASEDNHETTGKLKLDIT